MRILLDSSALLNIVKRAEISKLGEAATLDLALYEALNAVWKEHLKLKRIDRDTALELATLLQKTFNVIGKVSIEGVERETFEIACKHELTIYDASYVTAAERNNCTLITDDKKLAEKIKEIVKTKSSREI